MKFKRRYLVALIVVVTALATVAVSDLVAMQRAAVYRSRWARARSEIQALSTALESYRTDNGEYPHSIDSDAINPRIEVNPTSDDGRTAFNEKYRKSSLILYAALSGEELQPGSESASLSPTTMAKRYFEFNAKQLASKDSANSGAAVTALLDPFGNPYGYSTAQNSALEKAKLIKTGTSAVKVDVGYNPTFDLWSTAGKRTAVQPEWVRNW